MTKSEYDQEWLICLQFVVVMFFPDHTHLLLYDVLLFPTVA